MTLTLTFDTLLSGGFLANVGSLQFTDCQIEVSGGNATIANGDVAMIAAPGFTPVPAATDWSITGNGTPEITLLTEHPEHNGWNFSGAQGIQITGTWSTVTLTHYLDAASAGGQSWDSVAGFTVNGAAVVPEPSPPLVSALALLGGVVRRKRR
ncbi:MAG: hypothetical protein V4726_06425 [Verrucomicrobiota bacterium]